jgi:hypothetical protein
LITVDGAKLDSNTHRVTSGLNICDKKAWDPVTCKFLFANEAGVSDKEHLNNIHVGARCYPILAVIAKDNKDTYAK